MARKQRTPAVLLIPIEKLDLGTRTTNALKNSDIWFVGELCKLNGKKARAIKGLGEIGLETIDREFWKLGKLARPMIFSFMNFATECARRKTSAKK